VSALGASGCSTGFHCFRKLPDATTIGDAEEFNVRRNHGDTSSDAAQTRGGDEG
jgi:hypothetical protein